MWSASYGSSSNFAMSRLWMEVRREERVMSNSNMMTKNSLSFRRSQRAPEWPNEDDDANDKSTMSAVQPPATEETAEDGNVASSLEVVGFLVGILPIHMACQAHSTECVRFLTIKLPAPMAEPNDQGRTPSKSKRPRYKPLQHCHRRGGLLPMRFRLVRRTVATRTAKSLQNMSKRNP